jgi:hypothetical protein
MQEISWLAEWLVASQEVIFSSHAEEQEGPLKYMIQPLAHSIHHIANMKHISSTMALAWGLH